MMRFDVWRMLIRGRNPSWITCWVTENAPEMTAWDAITVATVASTTIAFWPGLAAGHEEEEGIRDGARVRARISAPCPM